MTRLFLLRHGETDFSHSRRYCGSLDISLNAHGHAQAELVAGSLKGKFFDAVYTSDLCRTVETAQIVFPGVPVIQQSCFREMTFGILEGLTYEEAVHQHLDIYQRWLEDPWEVSLPGAEIFEVFFRRVMEGLRAIVKANPGRSIALVSHGGPIRVILSQALERGFQEFWSIRQDTAALNVIDYHEGKPAEVRVINRVSPVNWEEAGL